MTKAKEWDKDELLTVDQLAQEYDLGRSTVWLHLRRHQVPRFRTTATGKTTLVRRMDLGAGDPHTSAGKEARRGYEAEGCAKEQCARVGMDWTGAPRAAYWRSRLLIPPGRAVGLALP